MWIRIGGWESQPIEIVVGAGGRSPLVVWCRPFLLLGLGQ